MSNAQIFWSADKSPVEKMRWQRWFSGVLPALVDSVGHLRWR